MTECVAARERLRVGHFHLFAAPLPRRRNPVTLSRSPNSSSTIRDRGEGFRLCATVDLWSLKLWRLRCPRMFAARGWRRWRRRRQRFRDRTRNRRVGIESWRSVRGTSNGALCRNAWGGGGRVESQRLGNGVLHRQRRLQGNPVPRVQDRGWGYPSCVVERRPPLSRRHREVVRGREAMGRGGGIRLLLARERQCIERLDKIACTFLVCFVLPVCHDDEMGSLLRGICFKGNQVAYNDWTTSALRTKRGTKEKVTRW